MKFITPCFVRVEDAEERDDLLEWLREIGYVSICRIVGDYPVVFAGLMEDCVGMASGSTVECLAAYELIDCGDNVELFKALAAMNYNNDYMQWFTDGRDWRLCPDVVVTKMVIPSYALYKKATAEEIIAHFKNVEILLKSRQIYEND